jgi:hypothetical protein
MPHRIILTSTRKRDEVFITFRKKSAFFLLSPKANAHPDLTDLPPGPRKQEGAEKKKASGWTAFPLIFFKTRSYPSNAEREANKG